MVLHNPNNWHWVDKNCLPWSRTYFAENLTGVKAAEGSTEAEITGVKSCEGDVDVSQRKGKVICLYDINLELNYKGKTEGEDDVQGTIRVPEVAYDTEEDEFQFAISINNDKASKEPVKALIRKQMVPQLRKMLVQFGVDLIETHGKDLQHPDARFMHNKQVLSDSASSSKEGTPAEKEVVGTAAYNTTTLKLEPVFNAPADVLFDTLLDPQRVAVWSRSKPDIAPEQGREYTLFNGNVSGKIIALDKAKPYLEMTWRLRDWKQGHFANMKINFVQGAGETTMKVTWSGIPVGQEEITQTNFEEYYVKPIKISFGFGAVL
ncbi:hsp90 co-chaperone Aha1p [Trichomonascus vanleenenianus]|uniref:Aha1p n=1 Tax=Trichomonascus vanleenenianus TaxID=2268995 RepID=UPI003EC97AB5